VKNQGPRTVVTGFALAVLLAACGSGGDDAELRADASALLQPADSLSDAELDQAVDTVRKRLAAAGFDDVDVSADDGGLLLEGTQSAVDRAVPLAQSRGAVRFRLADAMTTGAGTSTTGTTYGPSLDAIAAAYAEWDCAANGNPTHGEDAPEDFMVGCDETGKVKFAFAPSRLDSSHVLKAEATHDPSTNEWLVTMQFDAEGSELFFDLTKQAFEASMTCPPTPESAGCNAIGIVRDGVVLSTPASQADGIRGGASQITGNFTEQSANKLAAELSGGPLPTSFSLG
jgi:preprotein translocase subunit SecD